MNQQTVSVIIDHQEIARAIVRGRRLRSEMAWFLSGHARRAFRRAFRSALLQLMYAKERELKHT